jgi:hypothetical protein
MIKVSVLLLIVGMNHIACPYFYFAFVCYYFNGMEESCYVPFKRPKDMECSWL